MSTRKSRLRQAVVLPPKEKTSFIDPAWARIQPLIFSFSKLDLKKKAFPCKVGDGKGLLYVLDCFRMFSNIPRQQLEMSYPNCHLVPKDQICKHNLHDVEGRSPSGCLHQLGRADTPERIIGFFESAQPNLFQVVHLDLNHNLSGN